MKPIPIKELPKLNDLYNDPGLVAKQNDLNRLLNQSPKAEWIQEHPFAKGVKYIPIAKIEWLLTAIFIKWRVEIKEIRVIANAVSVTVKLHYQDPVSGEWDWQDGVGAVALQTKRDAGATDFTQIIPDAVMKAVPAAKSYAVKDAAEQLGRLFGKDLNRKEVLPYTNLDGKIDLNEINASTEQQQELYRLLKNVTNHDERDELYQQIAMGVSIEEYYQLKQILIDKSVKPIDKIRNGDSVKKEEINSVVNNIYKGE